MIKVKVNERASEQVAIGHNHKFRIHSAYTSSQQTFRKLRKPISHEKLWTVFDSHRFNVNVSNTKKLFRLYNVSLCQQTLKFSDFFHRLTIKKYKHL